LGTPAGRVHQNQVNEWDVADFGLEYMFQNKELCPKIGSMRKIPAFIFCLLLFGCLHVEGQSQTNQLPKSATQSPIPTKPGIPSVLRLRRVTEPRERAFTVLVPQGWQTEGGIIRVDPNRSGGSGNAIAAKCDFSIKRDAAATALMRFLPDTSFIDMRNAPAGRMGLFPPGSNYNGMTVYPVQDAVSFLMRIAFPYAHPGVQNPRILDRKPLRGMVEEMRLLSGWLPISNQFSYDAALVTLQYSEKGTEYKETMVGGIQNMSVMGAGMWSNQRTLLARAPVQEFEGLAPLFLIILHSIDINKQWLAGELQGQVTRAGIATDVLRYLQQMDNQITEHRRQTNAEINNDAYLTLTGQEEYVNPYTNKIEWGSNEWKYRWVTPSGDEVYANDDYFDPNHDPNSTRSDWKRSAVRKRLPQ
jgi:hypothetical protein